jgi:hypothetical protein
MVRERIGEDLERHVTIELRIVRAIYLPHAAGTEYTNDFVHSETGAGCEGQRLPHIIQTRRGRASHRTHQPVAEIVQCAEPVK